MNLPVLVSIYRSDLCTNSTRSQRISFTYAPSNRLYWLYLTLRSRSRGTPSKGVDSPKGSFQDSTVSGSFSSTDSSSTDPNNTISQIRKNEALNESIIVKNVLYSTQENVLAIHEVFRQVSLGIAIFCLLLILLLTNFKCK